MSYAKAMKHARNVRKSRAQSRMHFGFGSCSGPTPAARSNPLIEAMLNVRDWFRDRHSGDAARRRYTRECVREQVQELRKLRAAAADGVAAR